ncbi:hypothetical protein HFX_5019 (plasmid) [Haloferax mediterranei ATCC 33500]|uniref:Uncharacterized protein n=1 Tax=Haloferax mediterranei (strain ATCC 33500 / DSM 1411 / JCM 8866 / NBRC 14739 / NCIMB 2177 / R-4) TaxID=523841 RepID=I3R9E6_HALMT|nr:hypothetical protein HFX_5019 [Haloferax mediterranei ATCC 33500]
MKRHEVELQAESTENGIILKYDLRVDCPPPVRCVTIPVFVGAVDCSTRATGGNTKDELEELKRRVKETGGQALSS